MADISNFTDQTWWAGTAAQYPPKLAAFAEAIRAEFAEQQARNQAQQQRNEEQQERNEQQQAINQKAYRLHKSVEVVGEGGYLRLKRPTITDDRVVRPPEGEGDWELLAEDHVGEETL